MQRYCFCQNDGHREGQWGPSGTVNIRLHTDQVSVSLFQKLPDGSVELIPVDMPSMGP